MIAIRVVLFFLLTILSCTLFSQSKDDEKIMVIHRTADFALRGDGEQKEWNAAPWITLKKRSGDSSYSTEAKLLYSSTGIYCLFSCEDEKITATMREDYAPLYKEDVVEFFIWPDESLPLYLEYELSPLNFEVAALIPNIDDRFSGWKPWSNDKAKKTRHEVKIKQGKDKKVSQWTAEIFIPYFLLHPLRNVPPQPGAKWNINLYRIDYDNGMATWTWQPIERDFHDFKLFGKIQFAP
jgi:hypothetical protein